MLRITLITGEEVEVNAIEQLLPLIPAETQESLRTQINDLSAFNALLQQFIAQNRKMTQADLAKVVSTALRVLHLERQDIQLPGHPGAYLDWVMFHFLYADAHATAGKGSAIWEEAKKAIHTAQNTYKFNGKAVLDFYAGYVRFFLAQGIDAGNTAKLAELAEEADLGSSVGEADTGSKLEQAVHGLPAGKPFIMPFSYGGHQTYIRLSYIKPSYRLEYFDRQRQPLMLNGKKIAGYLQGTDMMQAQPVYFDFEIDPGGLVSICQKAQAIAANAPASGEMLDNAARQQVLEMLAGSARDVGVVDGGLEPAQNHDAINCAWASLESVIRFSLGAENLQKQVEFMREVVVTRYIARYGEPVEKAVAGLL